MSQLSQSVARTREALAQADLSATAAVREFLTETTARRNLDLSDLSAAEQAALIAPRSQQLQPSVNALETCIKTAYECGRPFVAKFGIDPTGAEVHLGHAVPMLILSRFQRMGHDVVFIVGDLTAKIGDPSGRSAERPALSDAEISQNLMSYREQVSPFFDFANAEFRHNGDWLSQITLPRILEITSKIPVSMPLQREDFRKRLESGQGLSLSELMYSVVMALDSVETNCDVEVGGIDQFLNMQMCRKVMEVSGQTPEIVVATSLIEGTDGTGSKMSKSQGNYVPLTAPPEDIFGKIMSIPDRLVKPYLCALTEWLDSEIAVATDRVRDGSLHPMDLKKILAGEVTAAIHGVDAAMKARGEFEARFSKRTFADVGSLPEIKDPRALVVDLLKELGFAKSNRDVWRVAQQHGLRLVAESGCVQEHIALSIDDAREPLAAVLASKADAAMGTYYLKFGRKVARIVL